MARNRDIWEKIDELRADSSVVPPGVGFTAAEYAEKYQENPRTVRDKLSKWLGDGKLTVIGKRHSSRVFDVVAR